MADPSQNRLIRMNDDEAYIERMRELREAIMGSQLPEDTMIRGGRTGGLVGFNQHLAAQTDPKLLRMWMNQIASHADQYPETVKGLTYASPTADPKVYAWFAKSALPASRRYGMGVPTGYQWPTLETSLINDIESEWFPGKMWNARGIPGYGAERPINQLVAHEFLGHAVEQGIDDWWEQQKGPGRTISQQAAYGNFDRLRDQLTAETLSGRGVSRYANENVREKLKAIIENEGEPHGVRQQARMILQHARSGNEVLARDLRDLPRYLRSDLHKEPFAEVASMRTPHYSILDDPEWARTDLHKNPDFPFEWSEKSQRALAWGERFADAEESLRATGFRGAINPKLAAGVAGAGAAALLAPIVISRLKNPRQRELASGAMHGANIGGLFGAPGALVGGGLGALASQVF